MPGLCSAHRTFILITCLDISVFFTVAGLAYCTAFGVIPPTHGGFHCNDESIKYKYQWDTFPTSLLLLLSFLPILGLFIFCELGILLERSTGLGGKGFTWPRLWQAICRAIPLFGGYMMCWSFNLLSNEITKTLVAEPRPHFIETCKPDWEQIDCKANNGYVRFNLSLCTGPSVPDNGVPRPIFDAMRSFPSGHAQIAMFSAVFAILYCHRRCYRYNGNYIVVMLQFAFLAFALSASITRITDKRHHWWDVAAGDVFGAMMACLAVKYRFDCFPENPRSRDRSETPQELEAAQDNPAVGGGERSIDSSL